MPTYDIAIIGAGPAGSATAIFSARRGYTVGLFDRAVFPRDKVCGDYLTAGAVALLRDELGVIPDLFDAGASTVHDQTIVDHNGRSFHGSVDGFACPRVVTDAILLDTARTAGVDVHEGFAVREVGVDGKRVTGFDGLDRNGERVRVRATVTVGADGTHSLLARRLGVVREIPRLHRLALSAYVDGLGSDLTMYLPQDRSLACCGFGAAVASRQNVNIVVPVSEARSIAVDRGRYFRERLAGSFPTAWSRLQGASIGPVRSTACFGHRTVRAAFDGAVLVGDAAQFVHPFTGEGVFYALEGARLASSAIDGLLGRGRPLSAYDIDRGRFLHPRYRFCDLVQHVVHSPTLLGRLTPRLLRSPDLTESILRTVGDIDPPHRLFTPANLGRLLTTG